VRTGDEEQRGRSDRAIPAIMVDPPAPAAGIELAGTVTEVVGLLGIGSG
jgi:hypothetical protein